MAMPFSSPWTMWASNPPTPAHTLSPQIPSSKQHTKLLGKPPSHSSSFTLPPPSMRPTSFSMKLLPWSCVHCTALPTVLLAITPPGALVFQCDMFLNLPLLTDIVTLTCSCQAQIDQNLLHINAHHIPHEYKIGQLIYCCNFDHNKLNHFVMGPSIFFKSTPTIVSPSPMVQFLNALVSIILVHFTHHKLPLCGRMNTPS